MKKLPPPPFGKKSAAVETFLIEGRTYELRYVNCGKKNCTRCNTPNGPVPSHGPYWYLGVPRNKKWFRLYIGKHLDTRKFITKEGRIDWARARHSRVASSDPTLNDHSAPGQLDAVAIAEEPDPADPNPTEKAHAPSHHHPLLLESEYGPDPDPPG